MGVVFHMVPAKKKVTRLRVWWWMKTRYKFWPPALYILLVKHFPS